MGNNLGLLSKESVASNHQPCLRSTLHKVHQSMVCGVTSTSRLQDTKDTSFQCGWINSFIVCCSFSAQTTFSHLFSNVRLTAHSILGRRLGRIFTGIANRRFSFQFGRTLSTNRWRLDWNPGRERLHDQPVEEMGSQQKFDVIQGVTDSFLVNTLDDLFIAGKLMIPTSDDRVKLGWIDLDRTGLHRGLHREGSS